MIVKMEQSTIDALNKEMYELTLRHYQNSLRQDVIMPELSPPITTFKMDSRLKQGDSGKLEQFQIPQKEKNNNRLADYQFNHILTNTEESDVIKSISKQNSFASTKDMINERLSGFSSLARPMSFTGFGKK